MIQYSFNLEIKAYNVAKRKQRIAYHRQMESIRNVNSKIMRRNLRTVFNKQKKAIKELEDPTDFKTVETAIHQTDGAMRGVFQRAYQKTAHDIMPMVMSTPKVKSLFIAEKKDADPFKQYFDVVLAQWVEENLGIKIVKVQQTTLEQLRLSYTRISKAYEENALQTSFRDAVIKDFLKTYDTNISTFRANCIARTECAAASNRAALETTKAMGGNPMKEWLAVPDEDTRDTHKAMDGKVIAMDDTFNVNGSIMDAPLDSTHGANVREIANCRCDIGFRYNF